MNFIDHTGHLFQMKSYSINPIGYDYETTKYIFWFNNENGYKISVDTYAIKPIRVLLNEIPEEINITISNSTKFSLISSKEIQNRLENLSSLNDSIVINENDEENKNNGLFVNELNKENLYIVDNLKSFTENDKNNYALIPFYVVVKSDEAGTWQSNVLIHVKYSEYDEEWCPISIAAEITDECEELIINGQNMGVYLPKEILKAVYQSSYYNDVPDERLYAQKLKEYLMNFMDIKGQTGNYKSALNGLKWFGWGEKLDVFKLLKNDNEFQNQYIRDDFDIINDTLYSYRYFKNDALLSIELKLYEDSEETEGFDFNNEFWGEDKPFVSDLFEKDIKVHYDEGDLDFYRSYFDFSFNELGLKLCMLKYYYEKYFLPLHLSLNSISMTTHVFANDIKMISNCSPKITAEPVFIKDESINVIFPAVKKLFLNAQHHIIDENFIEFGNQENAKWEIYETLVNVPIKFISTKEDQYYDVILSLYKDGKIIYSRNFQFIQFDLIDNESFNFIIHPKTFNRYLGGNGDNVQNEKLSLNLWLDSEYEINILANGNNYSYKFKLSLPDMILKIGTLKYKYDDRFRQICVEANSDETLYNNENELRFLSYMHMPNLVTVNNIDFIDDLYFYQDSLGDYVDKYYKTSVNTIDGKYLNVCHLYKMLDSNGHEINTDINYFDLESIPFVMNDGGKYEWNVLQHLDENKSLYKVFFNSDGSYVEELQNVIENNHSMQYDFYLMHDKTCWYVMLISKNTCDKFIEDETKAPILPEIEGYSFEYEKSDKKLLINRFILEDSNGINKFNNKDIIAFYLQTNDKLPFKIGLSTKWLIKPMSIGMSESSKVDSPNEIAIVSIGDNNFRYQKGYYSIVCRYSLDDFYQESMEKRGIFMVQ